LSALAFSVVETWFFRARTRCGRA